MCSKNHEGNRYYPIFYPDRNELGLHCYTSAHEVGLSYTRI
jgi:hypothetical protein